MICRRIAALVLLLILLLSACGPATVAPNPSGGTAALPAEAEPARAVIQDSFTMALPLPANSDDKEAYHAHLQRLQNLLRGKGWNVTLAEVPLPEGQTYEDYAQEFVDLVRKMAAAGKGPDAWRVSPDMAQRLRTQGLTQDMAAVMPAASALLWDLCKGAFIDGADGVPVYLTAIPKGLPVLLAMDTAAVQAYGSPITNVDDILTFLEKQPDARVWTDFSSTITDAWAAQQGYYPLAYFGLLPFLYARMDDADCTPVPVEDIDGFDGFFRRWTALWVNGRWGTPESDARIYSGILGGSSYHPDRCSGSWACKATMWWRCRWPDAPNCRRRIRRSACTCWPCPPPASRQPLWRPSPNGCCWTARDTTCANMASRMWTTAWRAKEWSV